MRGEGRQIGCGPLAWATVAAGVVLMVLSGMVVEQLDEGPPPGYVGGDIPGQYRGRVNPFALDDQRALAAGQAVYQAECAYCHGNNGTGDGPQAPYLEPAPANFSAPSMLSAFRDHPDYVFWWVSEGVAETGMPAFKDELSETERWQVITYAWYLAEQAAETEG
ncbi:MAG: c-type cytochrome [Sphingomonadaceae bacterium]